MELQMPFRFLDLPAELRNIIYELVFADNTVVIFEHRPSPAPALLLTSKRVYLEAANIFYGVTTFFIGFAQSLDMFASLPAELRNAITCVKLAFGLNEPDKVEKFLQECRERTEVTGAPLREGVVQVSLRTDKHDMAWVNAFGEVAKGPLIECFDCWVLWRDTMRSGRLYRETQYARRNGSQ